jgi:hypothetical protein
MFANNVDIQIHRKKRHKLVRANRNSEQENDLFQGHNRFIIGIGGSREKMEYVPPIH